MTTGESFHFPGDEVSGSLQIVFMRQCLNCVIAGWQTERCRTFNWHWKSKSCRS